MMTLHEIIQRSNTTCRRLGREEDGVVLGVMVVTLMMLFLMGATTFAVGEHIRDRIEIQNAVDAAAYSAAMVQADTFSRIAAINQAMAWTYVQMGRRHMDAILDRWLEKIVETFENDERILRDYYQSVWSAHIGCGPLLRKDWGIGFPSQTGGGNKQILFNKRHLRTIHTVRQDWQQARNDVGTYHDLEWHIEEIDEPNLEAMADAQAEMIAQLRERMENAAREVLDRNGIRAEGDWITIITGDAQNYFHVYGERNDGRDDIKGEADFLRTIPDFDDFETNGDAAMGPGAEFGQWFPRQDEQPWRKYEQRGHMLTAEWYGFAAGWSGRWFHGGKYGCQRWHGINWQNLQLEGLEGFRTVGGTGNKTPGKRNWKGEDVDGIPREIAEIEPHRLSILFFDGGGDGPDSNGAVIVAAARRMRHPFQVFVGAAGEAGRRGFYDVFGDYDAHGRPEPRLMVAAAAARAGYRDPGQGDRLGAYNPFSVDDSEGWHHTDENLGQTDWDAVLIPLRRAWVSLSSDGWAGADSGVAVLNHLWHGAEWDEVTSGRTSSGLPAEKRRPGDQRSGRQLEVIQRQFGGTAADLARSLYH